MSDTRLTIRLSPSIRKALRQKAKAIGKPESEVARAAIERDVARPRTAYDVFTEAGLIGCAPGGPPGPPPALRGTATLLLQAMVPSRPSDRTHG